MATIISFSIFELFTFLAFFFSIVSMVILTYILIRRRNILTIAKKRIIKKSQLKSTQLETKLNGVVLSKEKEIKELKQLVLKYKDIESNLLNELILFEENSEKDYTSLLIKLRNQVTYVNSSEHTSTLKTVDINTDSEKMIFSTSLKKKHSFLTDQEITLCTYFRNNIPSKEIALSEGITDGTVRVYKNKIKNKIGLSQMDSLNEYLNNIPIKKTV